jgi:opacity protein-like surface antigen
MSSGLLAEQSGRWTIGVGGLYSPYSHRYTYSYLSTTNLDIENGTGVEVFAALRQSPRVSWELAASELSFDARLSVYDNFHPPGQPSPLVYTATGDYGLRSGTLTLLFHPIVGRRFDIHVGPMAGWTTYQIDVGEHREDEFTYGAKIGVSIPVARSRWRAMLDYRYLQTAHETADRDLYGALTFPAVSLGMGYDF